MSYKIIKKIQTHVTSRHSLKYIRQILNNFYNLFREII